MLKNKVKKPTYCPLPRKHNSLETCIIALLALALLPAVAFGQGTSASISGTITDSSGGVLPGAAVIATNTETGVVQRTTTNNSGIYNFPSLPPGSYEIAAEAAGFQRTTRSGRFGVGSISLNIPLAVAGTVTEIAVTGTVDSVILEAGSSTGAVMQEEILQSIPLVGNNIMDIINVFGGVTQVTDPVWGAQAQQFAGVTANMVNVTRDGVMVSEVRQPSGVAGIGNINQEMIGEFKMILSAVDAEMGRGSGQVQMTTRSGSNAFHGSAVWNIQNTALDARDYSVKRSGRPASWRNLNNYILTASGPIVKNQTFFFVTWEQQIERDREVTTVKVLTPCAKKGIYRYITQGAGDGFVPAAYNISNTYNPGTGAVPSVDSTGRPVESGTFGNVNNPDMKLSVNGELQIRSVFGEWAPGVRENLLSDKGQYGVYGDCSNIDFTPTLGGTDTRNFYGTNTLVYGSYYGGDFTAGGAFRSAYDSTGFVDRFTFGAKYSGDKTVAMPPPNDYITMGDGLNLAGQRYYNRVSGTGGTIYGSGGDPNRKSITFKIDHNIGSNHRLSGTYTQESTVYGEYHGLYSTVTWPTEYGGYTGEIDRKPKTLAFSVTSTLRPTLLNEARFGFVMTDAWMVGPQFSDKNGEDMNNVLAALMPPGSTLGRQMIIGVGENYSLFHADPLVMNYGGGSHPLGGKVGLPLKWGGPDARFTVSDTITWMKGAHSFKAGGDWLWQRSQQDYNGMRGFAGSGALIETPAVFGGLTGNAAQGGEMRRRSMLGSNMVWDDVYDPGIGSNPTTGTGNYMMPWSLMTYFSGAINTTRQYFYQYLDNGNLRWNNAANPGETVYSMDLASAELSFFFKDDWKVTSDLTLNLGVRYEYYGVPYERKGYTPRLTGDVYQNAFGISKGGGWDTWINNRNYIDAPTATLDPATRYLTLNGARPEPVSIFQQVGPGSKNPGISAWDKDFNNFAPHIGFAWQLPWFGRGQTTLRGGWSVSYSAIDNFNNYGVMLADVDAANTSHQESYIGLGEANDYNGGNYDTAYYMDLADLGVAGRILNSNGLLDAPTTIMPFTANQVGQLSGSAAYIVDDRIRNPYVHSFNLSLTRQVGRALTVDIRYIASLGRDLKAPNSSTAINTADYINNGLYVELEKIRKDNSYQSPMINSLIQPGMLYVNPAFGALSTSTGTDQIRAYGSPVAANLATGTFSGVATALATSMGTINRQFTTDNGLLLRSGCLPDQRTAGSTFNAATGEWTGSCAAGTPWNFITANPQFTGIGMFSNIAMSNYHSMQSQVTLRPTRGLSFQATYTWSRNLDSQAWTNYMEDYRDGRDYLLSGQHRSHTLNTYGTWELPFGANGFLFRDATGAFKKVIEGWQLSWITAMASGAPLNVTGTSTLWNRSWPDLVRPDLWDDKSGKAAWDDVNNVDGSYFGDRYVRVADLGICDASVLAGGLGLYCNAGSARALALADPSQPDNVARYSSLAEALQYDSAAKMEGSLMPAVVVFRNVDQSAGPNATGNYQPGRVTGPGRLTFDMAASKSIEFMEGKRFEIRVDAQNILNHATVSNGDPTFYNSGRITTTNAPSFSVNGTGAFGRFTTKGGHRTFQARLRISF